MKPDLFADSRSRALALGGLVATVISLAVHHAGHIFFGSGINGLDVFFITNFVFAVAYWLIAAVVTANEKGARRFYQFSPEAYRITVILFTIAAFSLNRQMEVLGETPVWLGAYLYLAFLGLFLDSFARHLPPVLNAINSFLCGMGLFISFYFFALTLPILPYAAIGILFFGFSAVAFAPLFALVGFVRVFLRRKERPQRISYAAGLVLPVILLFSFMAQYGTVRRDLEKVMAEFEQFDSDLPITIFAAQHLPQRALQTQIFQVDDRVRLGLDDLVAMPLNDASNDPLTIVGAGLGKKLPLDRWKRREILAAQSDLRHQSQRRLWEDSHLLTREVNTEIEVYPDYRLAYTEKTFDIEHYGMEEGRFRSWQQEAVYTFHLPEGSVATSLSLWVDGKERKARFSSKKKADEAYSRIVGRERRDPALLHWQEGNTLVVTVFPVSPELPRKFKLGVTSPLRLKGDDLVLENIYFEGPTLQFAREKTHITFMGDTPQNVKMPAHFDQENDREWRHEGDYRAYWEMSCAAPKVSTGSFTFNGFTYQAFPYRPQLSPHRFENIYLDLNESWTEEEFEQVWQQAKEKTVWTFDREMKTLTEGNRHEVFASAREAHFSLFPLYKIEDPEKALIVSKQGSNFVSKSQIEHTPFDRHTADFLEQHEQPVAFYNLGGKPGPYMETLKQFGALNYQAGTLPQLRGWLEQGRFPSANDDPGRVVLPDAGMAILQSDAEEDAPEFGEAPDHLLRLFAYNKCLEIAGEAFHLNGTFSEAALQMAEEAYVVSPFTSLVVLETDKDYERFGIKESENSLGNAGLNKMAAGTGSVPEPHEWLLIGLVAMILIYTQRRRFRWA